MTAAPFDTLKLSRQLRERAHFSQEQAEGIAETLAESFHERIATKTDVQNAVKDRVKPNVDDARVLPQSPCA
jgi:hypothetical protein